MKGRQVVYVRMVYKIVDLQKVKARLELRPDPEDHNAYDVMAGEEKVGEIWRNSAAGRWYTNPYAGPPQDNLFEAGFAMADVLSNWYPDV